MSKEIVNQNSNAVTEFENFNKVFSNLNKLKPAPISDTMEYLDMEVGQAKRMVFIVTGEKLSTQETNAGELVPCAILVDENQQPHYTMAKVLVETCIDNNYAKFTPLLIERLKDGKNDKKHFYQKYKVTRLI